MTTASEAAARKTAQEAEAEASGRRPGTPEQAAELVNERPEIVDDNPTPATPPARQEPEGDDPPPPAREKPVDSRKAARDAIAARLKAQRDQTNAQYEQDGDGTVPPFTRPKREDAPPPAEEDENLEQQPARLKIKVNGEESEHTRDELIKMAGLEAEDAEDLPEKTLIKAAQIAEAGRIKLERTKVSGAPAAQEAPGDLPAPTKEPSAETTPRRRRVDLPDDVAKGVVEKIAYGDPDEAATALKDAFNTAFEADDTNRAEQHAENERQKAIVEFSHANQDIASDDDAADYLLTCTTNEIIKDLRAAGAPEVNLASLKLNPKMAIDAHKQARMLPEYAGKIRDPRTLLDAAGANVRKVFKIEKPTTSDAPPPPPRQQPQTPAPNARLEAKRRLSQQPERVGSPVPPPPPERKQATSDVIAKMRRNRGQAA